MTGVKATRAGAVYSRIREEIFRGELRPGQRLRFVELAARFSVSQSVVREALTRLSEQGIVLAAPQQGFRVADLSMDDLAELTEARVAIESTVLRSSVERGDLAWESAVVAAHHRLAGTEILDASGKTRHEWFAVHDEFHRTLLSGCGNSRLLAVATSLRDSAALYLRWSHPFGHDHHRDVASEHQALTDAALRHDAEAAVDLLARHIARTSASFGPTKSETRPAS